MAKEVMIVWTSVGGGHFSGMQALSEALLEIDPNVGVSAVDTTSSECALFPITTFPRIYQVLTGRYTYLWRLFYDATNTACSFAIANRISQPFLRRGLRSALMKTKPDVIICILPWAAHAIGNVLRTMSWDVPISIVVMDLVSIHQAWIFPGARWYVVPTEEAKQAVVLAGISQSKVHVKGIPLRKSFWDRPERTEDLRQSLGIPQDSFAVLIMGGADGIGDVEGIVDALLATDPARHLVVITGRNRVLRDQLMRKTEDHTCTILGYVPNIADWMWASDVLVTKAGPTTIVEAARCGLPVVLTGAIPGQEEGNLVFVREQGLGLVATNPTEIALAVTRILTDEELSQQIRSATARFSQPRSAHTIARLALDSN